jgi:hypothetical protein
MFDENATRFLPVPMGWEGLYRVNYAIKWEVAALLATLIITVQYWMDEGKKMRDTIVEPRLLHHAITATAIAVVCLVCAIYFLVHMLFAESRNALVRNFSWHFILVCVLSFCFLVADYKISEGVRPGQDPNNDLRNLSHVSVYLVDLPICASFGLLGVFCLVHWAEHSWFHFLRPYLHASPKPLEPVNLWTSEEYFMSGAIAFQYLLSTTVFVFLALGLVRIKGTIANEKSVETQIEFPK